MLALTPVPQLVHRARAPPLNGHEAVSLAKLDQGYFSGVDGLMTVAFRLRKYKYTGRALLAAGNHQAKQCYDGQI